MHDPLSASQTPSTVPAHDPLSLVGRMVADKYEVERFVAEGGFSLLYRAQHKIWNQPVAVKFLKVLTSASPQQRESLLASFIQEGKLLRELSSRTASILQAHDVGTFTTDSGEWYPYLILEWLEGSPLDQLIDAWRDKHMAPLSLEEVVRLLEPAAQALAVVHKKNIAHRDIKPANIFCVGDPHSTEAFVKVLDFGIAKVISDMAEATAASAKTGTGLTSFTPWYGAPEQFSKKYGATGPWTDVFAMALVMLELLTLKQPLDGDEIPMLALASTHPTDRPTPRSRGLSVSDEVEAVFRKAVAVNTTDRYASMGEFWMALCQAVGRSAQGFEGAPSLAMPTLGDQQRLTAGLAGTLVAPGSTSLGTDPNAGSLGTTLTPADAQKGSKTGLIVGAVAALAIAAGVGFATMGGAKNTASTATPTSSAAPASQSASAAVVAPKPPCPEGMVAIPAGHFFMGYDGKGATDDEKPPHQVNLTAFCIDVTEVTVEAYKACSDSGKCLRAGTDVEWPDITPKEHKVYGPLCNIDDPGRDKHPINCVTWDMADNYCRKNDKRLPTSAEWEYAVRGPDGRTYPWGDEPPDANRLNGCGKECLKWARENGVTGLEAMHKEDDGFANTAPVGSFPKGRSRYGLDDVIGNVMEWVEDFDGPYGKEEQKDPHGPPSGKLRVIRGGAWSAGASGWVRPSFRFAASPGNKSHGIGFRCAKNQGS